MRKLNDEPRDGRELSKDIAVFGHKWVDKVGEGVAKSRLTCQDFKRRGQPEDKNSAESPSNFCPTPHGCSRKLLEVCSLAKGVPRVKADLTSAFLIGEDQGDKRGQPVMVRPPVEWLDDYEEWYAMQSKEMQKELEEVPKTDIVWQVDGNLYGRQSEAAQYRDRLEEILTQKLPKDRYNFKRGKLDACVYHCDVTNTVLIHHIDDFDIAGKEEVLKDLLTVQFPKNGCKLKMGEFEYPSNERTSASEFLGRLKVNTDGAVITKPNDRHIETIL